MNLQSYLTNIVTFANDVVIPFLLSVAFLFFVWNTIRYFVFQGTTQEGKDKARATATYSVLAFVFLLIFWGIVNLFANSLGFNDPSYNGQASDYIKIQQATTAAESPSSQIEDCGTETTLGTPPVAETAPAITTPTETTPITVSPTQPALPQPETQPTTPTSPDPSAPAVEPDPEPITPVANVRSLLENTFIGECNVFTTTCADDRRADIDQLYSIPAGSNRMAAFEGLVESYGLQAFSEIPPLREQVFLEINREREQDGLIPLTRSQAGF